MPCLIFVIVFPFNSDDQCAFLNFRRSTRSAYAFAHEEGFGKLITSGRIMAKQPNREVLPALNKSKKTATQQQHNQRQRNRDTDIPNAVISDS